MEAEQARTPVVMKKLTPKQEKTMQEVMVLQSHLETMFGPKNFPPEIVGDLHDFYFTMKRISKFLKENLLENTNSTTETLKGNLYETEILIEELLQITNDLLPTLKKQNKKRQ